MVFISDYRRRRDCVCVVLMMVFISDLQEEERCYTSSGRCVKKRVPVDGIVSEPQTVSFVCFLKNKLLFSI